MAPWAPPAAGIRAARAVGAAAVVTTSAAGAHLSSGGRADAMVVGALLAVLVPSCWALTARRLGAGPLLGLLILAQAAVHLACTSGDASAGSAMVVGHLVGTAVSLVVLLWGERTLLAVADRVTAHWFVPRVATQAARTVPAVRRAFVITTRLRVLVVGERAPPAGA